MRKRRIAVELFAISNKKIRFIKPIFFDKNHKQ